MCGKYPTPSHFRALRGMPLIAVGERERISRPSRRVALSNDTFRGPVRLRRSLRRRAASSPTACLNFLHVGMYLHCTCFNYLLKYKVYKWIPIIYVCL